jgi:hypothetical protein
MHQTHKSIYQGHLERQLLFATKNPKSRRTNVCFKQSNDSKVRIADLGFFKLE